ncbi:MAG: Hsp70 family protein [Deltaproteobacteria bacterium]|nr:Hsp70 family protein [Deltaproteobacteria bacterium]
MKRIYGIDLGTTFSAIAYVDANGKPVVALNAENKRTTPSVVLFDGDQVVVGDAAREFILTRPDDVVNFIKRSMGDPDFLFENRGKAWRPEEISALILKKVVDDAALTLGEKIKDVVITCPAYFGINEREATRQAGELAGLNVRHILNEPTAAALAYGFLESDEKRVVFVYDLGGGTFDVTMMDIDHKSVKVICTGGDHQLGGNDWDNRLAAYMAEMFSQKTGIREDILDDPVTCQDLVATAERAKKVLSQRENCDVAVTYGGRRERFTIARSTFEHLTRDLLERTVLLTHAMLEEARKKGYYGVNEIIMVGGSSRMPQVNERLIREFGKKPRLYNPDEAIVCGAAVCGWKLLVEGNISEKLGGHVAPGNAQPGFGAFASAAKAAGHEGSADEVEVTLEDLERITQDVAKELAEKSGYSESAVRKSLVDIVDVTSKSFGVVALNRDEEEGIVNLVLKNTETPVSVRRLFHTSEKNQKVVVVQIVENDSSEEWAPIEFGRLLGYATFELPKGLPVRAPVEIVFIINREGRLEITAKERTTGSEISVFIKRDFTVRSKGRKQTREPISDTFDF